ncbi:MAG: DUF4399 domain-containing protein [Alphaproteobacteria bacterium]
MHFGEGQTETTLDLPPGDHKLQLVSPILRMCRHNPVVASGEITIHVNKAGVKTRRENRSMQIDVAIHMRPRNKAR